jgi:hypothetical protein
VHDFPGRIGIVAEPNQREPVETGKVLVEKTVEGRCVPRKHLFYEIFIVYIEHHFGSARSSVPVRRMTRQKPAALVHPVANNRSMSGGLENRL